MINRINIALSIGNHSVSFDGTDRQYIREQLHQYIELYLSYHPSILDLEISEFQIDRKRLSTPL